MIENAWKDYALRVLPPDAPAVQFRETKRAFFAGAQGLLATISTQLDQGSDQDAFAFMDRVAAELEAYCAAVKEGRA